MHIAIAAFIHGSALPFLLAQDPNFLNIIEITRNLGPRYTPPDQGMGSGRLLDLLYETSFKEMMTTLLLEVDVFGLKIYGHGATIKSVPLINILAAEPNNPFALLDIVDCTTHLQNKGKKDALYIAEMIFPLIQRTEQTSNIRNKKHRGIVDFVLMDGASNVQKGGRILAIHYPCITAGHCATHLVSLFFKDVYTQCPLFFNLHQFAKRLRNILGSCRHVLHAIFKKYTKLHNRGLHLGFIKDTEVRMAGAHITLCRVLQLKNALRATINSPEFIAL